MDDPTMSFDQAYSGSFDWNFPSPTATPTHTNFASNVFHTPKTATFPSHFNDAFTTPQMQGFHTPQQQQHPSMTPMQRPQTSAETLRSSFFAQQSANGTPMGTAMPPPMHPMQHSSPHEQSWLPHSGPQPIMQDGLALSFDSTQMQTPPPTRDSNRKRAQQPQQIAFGTPSTIASRRFNTPQQPFQAEQGFGSHHQPLQFPQLQFSPDMQQFSNMGPATAPVQSQTRLLWDQTISPQVPSHAPSLDDPFGGTGHISASMQTPQAPAVSFHTPAMVSFPTHAPLPRPASATQLQAPNSFSQMPPMSASVDPSLVYSSPARPVVRSSSSAKALRQSVAPPEAKRKDSAAPGHARSETSSSGDTILSRSSMGLRRSNTTGANRSYTTQTPMRAEEALSRSNSIHSVPRTASPLKRVGRTPLGSISESARSRPRPSVRLEIDENGRARTVIERREHSPTKALREKYPALWDSDSSESESGRSEQTPTRSASFSFSRGQERTSKAARLDAPVENLEGLNLPRSGSSSSMRVTPSKAAIAAAAQLRRQGSLRKTPSRNGSRRKSVMVSSTSSLIDSCPLDMSMEQPPASAGAERSTNPSPPRQHHHPSWPSMSGLDQGMLDQSFLSQEQPQHQPFPFVPSSTMGPIEETSFYGTPPTAPAVQQPPLIRCLCGADNDRGQPMVQCRSCTQWQHRSCIGLDSYSQPVGYACFLCTKPSVRIGKANR